MKQFFTFLFTILCISVYTQEPCGTKAPSEEWEQLLQTKITEYKNNLATSRIQQTNYVIPVIVHILHNGDAVGSNENIPLEQVRKQIEILNDDFRGQGYGYSNYPAPNGWPQIANTGITFCLAKQTPNGSILVEEGVERINIITKGWKNPNIYNTANALMAYFDDTIKQNSYWDPSRYLNIWIADFNTSSGNNGTLNGYAYFPQFTGLPGIPPSAIETENTSGVVLRTKMFGDKTFNFSEPYNFGRTLTHEIGHYLGVRHIFNDQSQTLPCFNSDECNDTPRQEESTSGCPTFPYQDNSCIFYHPLNGIMFMNFMDYTDDNCQYMFTPDQKDRMITTLTNGAFRWTLNNSPACQSPNKPDLTIINQSASPTNVNAGNTTTLSFIEKNSGGASASSNYVSFHISSNDILTPGTNGDRWIGEYYVSQSVPANSQTPTLNKQVTIPSDLASGTYYIFFSADGTESVNESIENNNFATVTINVTNTGGNPCSPTVPSNRTQTANQTYAVLNWSSVSGVASYVVRFRIVSSSFWQTVNPTANTTQISGLSCNTPYEWQVSSVCSNGNSSGYSASNTFNTTSCGTSQNNDNCIDAITLISSTSCNPISGTVANTTQSGYYIAACGVPQASATAYDVWYKFVAQATSETVSVDPVGNTNSNEYMDVVIGLYYGACNSANLVECYDKPSTGIGGGVTTTYTFNGLNIGSTYYVRVYDWVSLGGPPPIYPAFDICVTHQNTGGNNNHDFYMQDLSVNSTSYSAGDPLNINADQYTTNPNGASVNVNMDYTIRTNNGTLIQNLGTDNSDLGGGDEYDGESISTTFPSGVSSTTCLICAEANYDRSITESNTANNRSCVTVSVGNSNNHDFTIRDMVLNNTTFNPGDNLNINCYQYTDNPNGLSTDVNIEYTLRSSSGTVLQQLGTDDSRLGGGNEYKYENLYVDFPLTIPTGNYKVCAEANYDRFVSESNTNNNLTCINVNAVGCSTCNFALSSNSMNFQSGGGTGNFTITTNRCCDWSAISNNNWITVTSGNFLGNGTVFYSIEPCNSGTTRTGSITVAGQTFTITQNCSQACNLSQSFEWGAQAGSPTLSDAATDLAIDASNNLYMTGDIQGSSDFGNGIILTTPSTAPDIFVSKHNSSGQIQWAVRYGNTTQEEGEGIVTDNNGNVYVSGYFSNSITFGSTTLTGNASNNYTAFLIKLSSSGVLQWARKVNPTNTVYNAKLAIDRNNNIYVAGFHTDNSIYIAKYNSSGTQNWIQTYLNTPSSKYLRDVTCDNNGNVIIAGNFSGSMTLAGNTINTSSTLTFDRDGYVAKFDNNGNPLWIKQVASPHFDDQDEIAGVTADNSNNIYITGRVDTTATMGNITVPMFGTRDYKAIIFKLDSDGNAIWGKGSNNGFQIPNSIVAGNDKDIYISGYFGVDTFKLDNKYIVSNGSNDGFVARIDSNGIVKWMKTIGGTLADEAFGVVVNNTNDVYVAGGFRGTVSYGSTTLTSNGSTDIFLTKFKQCDLPIANITYSGAASICNGQSKLLTTPFCNTNSYQWMLNGNNIPNANASTYNATQTGTYSVKVSAFIGCESISNDVSITTSNPPSVTILGHPFVCSGQTTLLDAGAGFISYEWSTGASVRQINAGVGNYSVTVTNSNNCQATAYKSITPLTTPTANITFTNIGNTYSFSSNADGDSIIYNWNFGDGNSSDVANPTHTYLSNGAFIITLTVSNRCGNNNYQRAINLATSISVNSTKTLDIKIYPNPNNGQFIAELNSLSSGNGSIIIYNAIGEKVLIKDVTILKNQNKIPIDLSNLANGIYHISFTLDNEIYNKQVIKIE